MGLEEKIRLAERLIEQVKLGQQRIRDIISRSQAQLEEMDKVIEMQEKDLLELKSRVKV